MSELLTDEELAHVNDARRMLAHFESGRGFDIAPMTVRGLLDCIRALAEQRDRARDWAVQLEQELNAAGGHAHANQQAIEGEA